MQTDIMILKMWKPLSSNVKNILIEIIQKHVKMSSNKKKYGNVKKVDKITLQYDKIRR